MLRTGARRVLLYKRPAGGGAATGVSTDTSVDDAAASTTVTFTNQSIGTASATRIVVVGVGSYLGGGSGTISSVTVDVGGGPIGLTRIGGVGDPDLPVDMWQGNITTGTTADIVVTTTTTQSYTGIAVAALDNVNSTATDTCGKVARGGEGTPYVTTTPLTVPTNGIGVVFAHVFNITGLSYNNLTEDLETAGTTSAVNIGRITVAGDISPSLNSVNFAGVGMMAAAWGPA